MPEIIQKNQSQRLADRIRRHIEQSRLPNGELYMTEAQVAETFNVSRAVAREAVSQLRAIGLLEGRKRKGLIVRHPDPAQLFSASLPSVARSQEDLADLARLRYALEVGAIELAVKNATDDQITRLVEIADEMKAAGVTVAGSKKAAELDLAFHALLLEMTASKLIAEMQRVLVAFFRDIAMPRADREGCADHVSWEHIELAAAVRDRDIERARTMIRMQLRGYLPEGDDGLRSDANGAKTE